MLKERILQFFTVQPKQAISNDERRRSQAFMIVPVPLIVMLFVMMVMLVLFPDNTGQGTADTKTYLSYFVLIGICISFYSASFLAARRGKSRLASSIFVGTLTFGIFSAVMGDPRPGTASLSFPYITVLFAVMGTFNSALGLTIYYIIATAIILFMPSIFPTLSFGAHVHFTILNTIVFLISLVTAKIRKGDGLEIKTQQQEIIHAARLSSLGEMASGIAHEINNPLAIIRGKTEILALKTNNGDIKKEDILATTKTILTTLDRTSKIVKGLLTFSRTEGRLELQRIQAKVPIQDVLGLIQERVKANNIHLQVELDESLYIMASPIQLGQVIMNLVNNAFDAIETLPEKWIHIALVKTASSARISITDSGHGIPAHVRSKMMDPFYTTKEPGKGTGLGLSISKGIIDSHNGKFSIDETSKNTKFLIDLPLSDDPK